MTAYFSSGGQNNKFEIWSEVLHSFDGAIKKLDIDCDLLFWVGIHDVSCP